MSASLLAQTAGARRHARHSTLACHLLRTATCQPTPSTRCRPCTKLLTLHHVVFACVLHHWPLALIRSHAATQPPLTACRRLLAPPESFAPWAVAVRLRHGSRPATQRHRVAHDPALQGFRSERAVGTRAGLGRCAAAA
eukprot:scaffold23464_cov43-Phaeocystis_antarctica.AAC.1